MELLTLENGLGIRGMGMVNKYGLMERNMKVNGKITKQKEKESSTTLMVIPMKVRAYSSILF